MTQSTTPMAPLTVGRLMPPAPTKLYSTRCSASWYLAEKGDEIMGVAADTICRCMKKKKLRQKTVAASLNENPRQINQQLRRMDDIKVERFCKYADALGYDVAVIDRESGEVEKLDPAKNNL